jgi:hypothetical protein
MVFLKIMDWFYNRTKATGIPWIFVIPSGLIMPDFNAVLMDSSPTILKV